MKQPDEISHLFRNEYRKIVAVLCRLFGIEHVETAEDIASDTFLLASELWGLKGLPENPTAWLYIVAKNKTKDYLKRNALFLKNISKEIRYGAPISEETDLDLSVKNINDSQLMMIFVVCNPCNPMESQISLALNLLCGFGAEEIANAFLTNKEVVYKRIQRAKNKLREEKISLEDLTMQQVSERLPSVLITLYLLFNEGYHSLNQDNSLRKEVCAEAARLVKLLTENELTDQPSVNALLSLMYFHSSRFDARFSQDGEIVLYHDQDAGLWDGELIERGRYFLDRASHGDVVSRYHLEAGIAYWHTDQSDSPDKWNNILQLYNHLLVVEYSTMAALNRTYALSKANGKAEAIVEAEKINLEGNYLYHSLLGELYTGIDQFKAIFHLQAALALTRSATDKRRIQNKMVTLAGLG